MKTLIALILLAFAGSAWASELESGLGYASDSSNHRGVTANLDDIKAAVQAANGEVKLSATSEDSDKEATKVALCTTLTCTFPSGKIKVIELKDVSSEVVNAMKRTYEGPGFGASVTVSTSK